MKAKRYMLLGVSLLAGFYSVASYGLGSNVAAAYTDQIIVKYRGMKASLQVLEGSAAAIQAQVAVSLSHYRLAGNGAQILKLAQKLPIERVHSIAKRISGRADVIYAEPDIIMTPVRVPDDPNYNSQWHYFETTAGINSPSAWDISLGSGVYVAVLDTGLTAHADLSGQVVPGIDMIGDPFVSNDGNGRDTDARDPGDWVTQADMNARPTFCSQDTVRNSSWHGTHVAGTVAARSNNGIGVSGVAWEAKIVPVRVLGKCGGYLSDISDGMLWAVDAYSGNDVPRNQNPAKVLNLSLGAVSSCPQTYKDVIATVRGRGAIIVAAAGNKNANASSFTPANCPGVIAVAAIDRFGNRAPYSNHGSTIFIAAPGGNFGSGGGVLSTLNSGTTTPGLDSYAYYQGTSMAAPHVSGTLALMYSANPNLSESDARGILVSTARPFAAGSSCSGVCGSGIVDAFNSVTEVKRRMASVDSDADGMPDVWETQFGLNPQNSADAGQDPDGDGLSNIDEYRFKVNPRIADTDGDGIGDGAEVSQGRNPAVNEMAILVPINSLLLDD